MLWESMFNIKNRYGLAVIVFIVFLCVKQNHFKCTLANQVVSSQNNNSACLILNNNQFLTVLNRNKNAWDFPGGTANKNESSQCVAQRETFEETHLKVSVGKKVHEYENGFSLYLCDIDESLYAKNYSVPFWAKVEIKAIQWHKLNEIHTSTWRFPAYWPETKNIIKTMMKNKKYH